MSASGFSGKKFAGVLSGLTRKSQHKGGERLDNIGDEGWTFSLNKKYKDIIKNYFKEFDEDK